MRQSACLVFKTIVVDNCAAYLNCTPVGRAPDSVMAPFLKLFILVCWGRIFLSVAWPTGVQMVFFFCSGVCGYLAPRYLHRRASYSICESSFLINHGGYHGLFVCP